MENNQQGRRKPDNQVLTNPAKFFIQWKSKDEAFIYYNKDKKVDVKMPKPFVFKDIIKRNRSLISQMRLRISKLIF